MRSYYTMLGLSSLKKLLKILNEYILIKLNIKLCDVVPEVISYRGQTKL